VVRLLVGLAAAGLLGLVVGCGEGAPDDSEVLISLTDQVIVPTFQAAGAAAAVIGGTLPFGGSTISDVRRSSTVWVPRSSQKLL
jgi:hypothetical protein